MRPYLDEIAHQSFAVMPLIGKKLFSHHGVDGFMEGMTRNHIGVLFILRRFGTLRMSELCQKSGLIKSNLTPVVDWLLGKGLVERKTDPEDRRVVMIELTGQGRELLEKIWEHIETQFEKLFAGIEDGELMRFLDALKTVTETLNRI